MFFALCAYFRVLIVSSTNLKAGVTQEMNRVLALPPRLSFNSLVSLESLYGMCFLPLSLLI